MLLLHLAVLHQLDVAANDKEVVLREVLQTLLQQFLNGREDAELPVDTINFLVKAGDVLLRMRIQVQDVQIALAFSLVLLKLIGQVRLAALDRNKHSLHALPL